MINTVTLNPALDLILYLGSFRRNITNRTDAPTVTMGGKGTHVSMDLQLMGVPSRAYGFGYGESGKRIMQMLEQSGVQARFVYDAAHGESRSNYLIVEKDSGDATLIATKGPTPTDAHVQALYDLMDSDLGMSEALVLSGDASNFPDPQVYDRIMDRLAPKNLRIYLDASGATLLQAVQRSPFLIKPNQDEMELLTGLPMEDPADVRRGIEALDRRCSIENIVVSMGGQGSLARIGSDLYRIRAPKVNVSNTVGCGDCLLAGLIRGFEQNLCPEELLAYATACSASTAESPLSVGFDTQRAKELISQVQI